MIVTGDRLGSRQKRRPWPTRVFRGSLGVVSGLLGVTILSACGGGGGGGGATASTSPNPPTTDPGQVIVSGIHLVRDGSIWAPHGYVMIAFVAPPAAQAGVFKLAYQNYNPSEFAAMKALGADTVRMQVSQPGLDPESPLYTSAFVSQVQSAVLAARSAGLNVIVSVQDESQSGETNPATLPNAGTTRVWGVLAPLFNGDTGILYELMNEPEPQNNAENWQAWAAAMNPLIASIRATGSKNVVVADGLAFGNTLNGAPFLTDSANAVAYASHPYYHSATDETQASWATRFGNFAATAPVIITEWTTVANAAETGSGYYCDANTASAALAMLNYFKSTGVGITAYAYDFAGNAFGSAEYGFPPVASSFANNAQCGAVGYGPGTILQSWYQSGAVPSTLQ